MAVLIAVYIISLIVGGGLLLLSLLVGGNGNADVHADVSSDLDMAGHTPGDLDHPVGGDHSIEGGHGISLASWFSIQFVVYSLAIFGLIGTTMAFVAKADPRTVLAFAVLGGVLIGQLVHQALRALKRSGGGSDLTAEDFLKQPARVTIAIEPLRRGEIAVATRTGERFLAAVSRRSDDRFKVGDRVVVVGLSNGVAEVLSKTEYDFVSDPNSGEKS